MSIAISALVWEEFPKNLSSGHMLVALNLAEQRLTLLAAQPVVLVLA